MARAKDTTELGTNVVATVDGNKLTLEFDLSQDNGPTKSGKTHMIATTSGFAAVPGHADVIVSLNVNRKKK